MNSCKLQASLAIALLSLAGAAPAQTTASKTMTVQAALTSQCRVDPLESALTLDFGTYIAFGLAATFTQKTINFQCTRGLGVTPTFAWDATNGVDSGSGGAEGVLAGLRYSLTAANGTLVSGSAPVLATPNDLGTPDIRPVTINGSVAAGQAGTKTAGTVSHIRTLTVTF